MNSTDTKLTPFSRTEIKAHFNLGIDLSVK